MAKQYFRTIQTTSPNEAQAAAEQAQKLNNYLTYNWPVIDANLGGKVPISYSIEVHHMAESSVVKNNWFVLTTTLCCEDETPGEEKKEY